MVRALDSGSRGLGSIFSQVIVSSSWTRHCKMGTTKLSGKPDDMLGGYL